MCDAAGHVVGRTRHNRVSGGANIDGFWRIKNRHVVEAPPMALFAIGGVG
jgi:hypothetical protein